MLLAANVDVPTVAATIAVTTAVIGAMLGGYAAIGQRKTDDTTLLYNTLQSHMVTLSSENSDLRGRVTTMEKTISSLREEVRQCEQGKELLQVEIHQLKRRLNSGGV